MLPVIICLILGCIVGVFLRNRDVLLQKAEKASSLSILLLLFLLGISVGTNETVISRFSSVGISGILLAVGAIMGSILMTLPLYLRFFRHPNMTEEENA